jgi:peptidoglycan/xylan/chitin deacetylase (PgdA/CDA1 family)
MFAQQMAWVAEHGLAISLPQLQHFVAGEESLANDSLLVTIDDGCLSTHEVALPILRHHGIPAVAFVTAGLIGKPGAGPTEPERYMTWGELESLSAAGMTIGSHAWSHRSLGRLSAEQVREEGERSRELLRQRIGQPVDAFAYPFGTQGDFSELTDQILRQVGYQVLFSSQHGSISPGASAAPYPRIKVEGGEGMRTFAWICRGAMDSWRLVDAALWRWQRVRREQDAQQG